MTIESVDIGIFYGIKLLLSIGVLFIHTFGYCYMMHLPSSMLPPRDPPLAPWTSIHTFFNSIIASSFSWLLHAVNIFWFISGFLTAYKLYFIPKTSYSTFLLNRLFRLYPLWITFIAFMYATGTPGCTTLWHVLKALLFIENFFETGLDATCSGPGWSLSLEMQSFFILMILFYLFDPKKKRIIYVLWMIFIASWIISIYMFHVHCLKYLKFGDADASLIAQGVDNMYPDSIRNMFGGDAYNHMNTSIYDPDNLTEDQMRNQMLYNNYMSSLYFPTYTQIGAGLLGAISCLYLLSHRNNGYVILFIFFMTNYGVSSLYFMTTLMKELHIRFFEFNDSLLTSIVLGSSWKLATLSVFCGMNVLLRMNNKFVNGALNNRFSRYLCKYTYCVYLIHLVVIGRFTLNDEYREFIASNGDGGTGLRFISIFGKSVVISFSISMALHHGIEYPFAVWRKENIVLTSLYQKKKIN